MYLSTLCSRARNMVIVERTMEKVARAALVSISLYLTISLQRLLAAYRPGLVRPYHQARLYPRLIRESTVSLGDCLKSSEAPLMCFS